MITVYLFAERFMQGGLFLLSVMQNDFVPHERAAWVSGQTQNDDKMKPVWITLLNCLQNPGLHKFNTIFFTQLNHMCM